MIKKSEIMDEEQKPRDDKVTVRINMNMIVVGALLILVFVSVIQTVTLANLIGKKPANAKATTGQPASNGNTTLPAALKDVPQQVGGC